jgi:hypothetical protein
VRFEFECGIVLFYFSFIFGSFGESCLLLIAACFLAQINQSISGDNSGMACSDEDRGRSRRPGAEDR